MGGAALRAPVGGWGPRYLQRFCHGSLFAGQLLSRKLVSIPLKKLVSIPLKKQERV